MNIYGLNINLANAINCCVADHKITLQSLGVHVLILIKYYLY